MFGWRISRVTGRSMTPSFEDGDYVLSRKAEVVPGDVVLIRHPAFGLILKRILRTDEDGCYIVGGDNSSSTPSDAIGPVIPDNIAGVIQWRIAPSGFTRIRNSFGYSATP